MASQTRLEEKRYIAGILSDFLKSPVELKISDISGYKLTDSEGRKGIRMPSILLDDLSGDWLTENSLPSRPLPLLNLQNIKKSLETEISSPPILYSLPNPKVYWIKDDCLQIEADLIGSIFFLLTRYEEMVSKERDVHGRFPLEASIAYRENFIDRPLVDEYIEIIRSCLRVLWPSLRLEKNSYEFELSHDIDHPFRYFLSQPKRLLKSFASDILKGSLVKSGILTVSSLTNLPIKNEFDPFATYSWIMDIGEKKGIKSTFNFMAAPSTKFDFGYSVKSSRIQSIFSEIKHRGHQIGFHPGYYSYNDYNEWKRQYDSLQNASPLPIKKGRQHYLRLNVPQTWQFWERSGCLDDSSLGFAEQPGFRAGTCQRFRVFDLSESRELGITETPLIMMDTTLFNSKYMKLQSNSEILQLVKKYKDICIKFGGVFSLLWHNNSLASTNQKTLYEKVISLASD